MRDFLVLEPFDVDFGGFQISQVLTIGNDQVT